jgi:Fe-S cluster biogenesis protein NfuA/nitrite reductase/ring-hydroxylating ferredoxin subunit
VANDPDVREVGARIEEILSEMRAKTDPRTTAAAEELVRSVVELYGAGLEQIVHMLREEGPDGEKQLLRLTDDRLVESLLVLHELHPLDLDARIQRALDRVRPYLGSHAGGVEFLGVDAEGVARLKLEGTCHGCPSSTVTVRLAIETAIVEAAPEVTGVEVEGVTEPAPKLLQIGHRPVPGGATVKAPPGAPAFDSAVSSPADGANWVRLPQLGPATARPFTTTVESTAIAVCDVHGSLYAYRDVCPICESSFAEGRIDGPELGCPGCGSRFDVRRAGFGLAGTSFHLDPFPLLEDSEGVRIAVPLGMAP